MREGTHSAKKPAQASSLFKVDPFERRLHPMEFVVIGAAEVLAMTRKKATQVMLQSPSRGHGHLRDLPKDVATTKVERLGATHANTDTRYNA